MKQRAKHIAKITAQLIILPIRLWFVFYAIVFGEMRAVSAMSQRISRWPGVFGEYLRRAMLERILNGVGKDVVISFGTLRECGPRLDAGIGCTFEVKVFVHGLQGTLPACCGGFTSREGSISARPCGWGRQGRSI